MNETRSEEILPSYDDELRQALIDTCRLSVDAIERINEAMRMSRMDFGDAAVNIGLVTANEAADAHAWVRAIIAGRNKGVIETALNRQGNVRSVIVRPSHVGRPANQLLIAFDPDSPRSERIRALRTELTLLNEAVRQSTCLAILSPRSGEGRSQVAAELAIAFSQIGRRTLLVDADLRKPAQHLLFGADSRLGLAQSLAYSEPAQVIGVEGLPFLSVVPSGTLMPNASALLSGTRFESLIRRWRNDYEIIILDTSPVSQCADALTIAAMAGSVLILSRAQSTPYKDLKDMISRLGSTKSRILGAVINNF
jgi:protein-tyrosine kinase